MQESVRHFLIIPILRPRPLLKRPLYISQSRIRLSSRNAARDLSHGARLGLVHDSRGRRRSCPWPFVLIPNVSWRALAPQPRLGGGGRRGFVEHDTRRRRAAFPPTTVRPRSRHNARACALARSCACRP